MACELPQSPPSLGSTQAGPWRHWVNYPRPHFSQPHFSHHRELRDLPQACSPRRGWGGNGTSHGLPGAEGLDPLHRPPEVHPVRAGRGSSAANGISG